jgi:hypothetical protein
MAKRAVKKASTARPTRKAAKKSTQALTARKVHRPLRELAELPPEAKRFAEAYRKYW